MFLPNECFHVGLPVSLVALVAPEWGKNRTFREAQVLLKGEEDPWRESLLEGTLFSSKTYLPREPVSQPSKRARLYARPERKAGSRRHVDERYATKKKRGAGKRLFILSNLPPWEFESQS